MDRTHELRGEGTGWSLPISSKTSLILFNALFFAGCTAPGADAPFETTPPRAEPTGVETSTSAPGLQAPLSDSEEAKRARWHAMWLSAGGTPPPDLPAALANVRKTDADIALELVRETLEGPESGAVREELTDLLTWGETDDLLWCAAARTAAKLSLHEVTSTVAVNLESPSAARRVAAREVLFNLRGEWFFTTSEAEVNIGEGPPPTEAQLASLLATTERLWEHAAALYVLDPAWATAALSDPDPQLRVAAARALDEALALPDPPKDFDPDRARSALFERLEVEEHPLVLYVLIGGFLERLGLTDKCTSDGREFAGALHARVGDCDFTMLAPLVHGLTRMPLDPGMKDASDVCSLDYTAEALFGDPDDSGEMGMLIEWMRPGRLVDADALTSALRSLETFFERTSPDPSRIGLREVLLETIDDPLRDASIRAGSARVLVYVGRPEDLPRLGAALTEAPTGVAYELIGTITKLVEEVEATNESAIAAGRDAFIAMILHNEASLRRRALVMLSTDPLTSFAETIDTSSLLVVLEEDLPSEDSGTVLELLARRKDPSLVDALFSSSAFDRLVDPDSGTASILTETLGRLAVGDGPLTYDVARRLIETAESEGGQLLRNALALLAALPESAARDLQLNQHADVIRWSIELREVAGTLAGVTEEEPPITFLERLTELHSADLERLTGTHEGDSKSEVADEPWAHRIALLRSDLFAAQELDHSHPLVIKTLGNFHAARSYADDVREEDKRYAYYVYRDHARFLFSIGESLYLTRALSLYRMVFNEQSSPISSEEESSADSFILDLADLRRAASLSADKTLADPESVPTALDLTLALIDRKHWKSEPAGVRLRDLRDLVDRAGDTEDGRADLYQKLRFADLPAPGDDPAGVVLSADAPWLGLETDPEQLVELRQLAVELETLPPAPEEPDPADPPEESETSEEVLETASEEELESGA